MKKKSNDLIVVSHHSSHHSTHSGYSPLVNYLPCTVINEYERNYIPWRAQRAISRYARSSIYNTVSLGKEIDLIKNMLLNNGGIAHFLNGENDYYFSGYFKTLKAWILIATLHFPPMRLREIIPDPAYLNRLDGIFCVARNQVDYLKSNLKHKRIWFVPLGIDTEFFYPIRRDSQGHKKVLFVGQHLRDFNLLEKVIGELRKLRDDFEVVTITRPEYKNLVPSYPWVKKLSGVPETELRALYHTSSLLLLPLVDSTANCAILEAMACGLPIVTTDVGGVKDYVNEYCAFSFPSTSIDDIINATSILMTDQDINNRMGLEGRIQALKFSWEKIIEKMRLIYQESFSIQLGN